MTNLVRRLSACVSIVAVSVLAPAAVASAAVTVPFQINPAPFGNPNGSFDAPPVHCVAVVGEQPGTVTITGANDVATIGGALTGTMGENAATATGQATISDLDAGQSRFTANSSIVGTYGHLSIDTAGAWTYTRDANMDSLASGSSADGVDVGGRIAGDGGLRCRSVHRHAAAASPTRAHAGRRAIECGS